MNTGKDDLDEESKYSSVLRHSTNSPSAGRAEKYKPPTSKSKPVRNGVTSPSGAMPKGSAQKNETKKDLVPKPSAAASESAQPLPTTDPAAAQVYLQITRLSKFSTSLSLQKRNWYPKKRQQCSTGRMQKLLMNLRNLVIV